MNKKKLTKQTTTTVIDSEGVVLDETTSSQSFSMEQEPGYVKMYLQDITQLFGITSGVTNALMLLLRKMNYDNQILLNFELREEICKSMKIKQRSLRGHIDNLCAGGILRKITVNYYEVNPNYFGKGKWQDIKSIRMKVEYNETGRTVSTEIA